MSNESTKLEAPRGWIPSDAGGEGGKLHAPGVDGNTAPILAVLTDVIAEADPPLRLALELASGSGEHAVTFARTFPDVTWQPSERDPAGLASIAAYRAEADLANLAAPVHVDLEDPNWHAGVAGPVDLAFASNLLHVSPWTVALNTLAGGGHLLSENGVLAVYGCFSRAGDFITDGNRVFNEGLRSRNPEWGVRDTEEVAEAATRHGLTLARVVPMPSNNTMLLLRRG